MRLLSKFSSVIKLTYILHSNFAAVLKILKTDPKGFPGKSVQNLHEEPAGFFVKKKCTTANQTLNLEV
jgi:hypothetical protein